MTRIPQFDNSRLNGSFVTCRHARALGTASVLETFSRGVLGIQTETDRSVTPGFGCYAGLDADHIETVVLNSCNL
jgi:hypothetical protein